MARTSMSTDFQNLKLRMAALPADELLDIVTFDVADYRADALDLAREELYRRGFSNKRAPLLLVSLRPFDAKNTGSHGNRMTSDRY